MFVSTDFSGRSAVMALGVWMDQVHHCDVSLETFCDEWNATAAATLYGQAEVAREDDRECVIIAGEGFFSRQINQM